MAASLIIGTGKPDRYALNIPTSAEDTVPLPVTLPGTIVGCGVGEGGGVGEMDMKPTCNPVFNAFGLEINSVFPPWEAGISIICP